MSINSSCLLKCRVPSVPVIVELFWVGKNLLEDPVDIHTIFDRSVDRDQGTPSPNLLLLQTSYDLKPQRYGTRVRRYDNGSETEEVGVQ